MITSEILKRRMTVARERRERIGALRETGMKFGAIGRELDISESRAQQLHAHLIQDRKQQHEAEERGFGPLAGLGRRARLVLDDFGETSLDRLLEWDRPALFRELLKVPNCGRRTAEEILAMLDAEHDQRREMKLSGGSAG